MSPDDQLSAFLGETPRQSRADLFTLEVIKRVERRAFVSRLVVAAVWAVALAVVLWACAPVLDLTVAKLTPALAPTATVLAFVAAILMICGSSAWRGAGLFPR